jgi:hypothetical protein
MGGQVWRSVALTVAAVALTVSCGWAAAIYAAEIPAGQVEGLWTSEAGTSLTETGEISTADESVTRGTVLSLTFSATDCAVDVYLFGDEDDPVMCPTDEPDDGCPTTGYLSRTSQAEKHAARYQPHELLSALRRRSP